MGHTPTVDTDAEAQVEAALIALVRRATDPRGNKRLNEQAGVDLERSGWVLLARTDELEPARLSDLAVAAGVDISTASRQMAPLVAAGYVDRSPDPTDRRASVHRLTPSGQEVLERLRAARREWVRRLLADFDPTERDRFAALLTRFTTALDEDD